jgi:hypothetical protein
MFGIDPEPITVLAAVSKRKNKNEKQKIERK